MTKADYSYMMYRDEQGEVIIIMDNNTPGKMSVTNDIENVIEEICIMENIDPKSVSIVYSDSTGNWDGWDTIKKDFIHLNCDRSDAAITVLRSLQNE